MRPSRQTPSSLSQRVQRHSELWLVGLVFAVPDQLDTSKNPTFEIKA